MEYLKVAQSVTVSYKNIRNSSRLYRVVLIRTEIYGLVQGPTELYGVVQHLKE